jgi:hypothetical protein
VTRYGTPAILRYAYLVSCEECIRLRGEHERLNRAYIAAHKATDGAYGGTAKEFTRLRTVSNGAWLDAEIARAELERHQREHLKVN